MKSIEEDGSRLDLPQILAGASHLNFLDFKFSGWEWFKVSLVPPFNSPLFKIPGYRRLWFSILFSDLGGQISLLALPLTAVVLLQASPSQMGMLTAMEILPFVLLSLPGGVLLDRCRKLPIYIFGEILMGLCLLLIPGAWWFDQLSMGLMYVVAFGMGAVYTIAGSASQIVLTQMVGRENLVQAYSQNALAVSAAEVLGPGMAGILIRLFGAPLALLMDGVLLIGSVLMLKGIRIEETLANKLSWRNRSFRSELRYGLNFVVSNPLLLEMAAVVGAWQFFAQMALSVQIIFAVKDLGLDEAAVSISFVALGLGSVLGGLAGPRLSARIGPGPALILGIGITPLGWLCMLGLEGILPASVLFVWMLLCFSWGATFLFVNFLSLRQALTPTPLLGRMTTTMRWLILIPAGPGALLGGWMAEHWGMRSALACAAIGSLCVALVAVLRPQLRSLKTLPLHHS